MVRAHLPSLKTLPVTLALACCSVACGPRVSQWIVVTDCEPPHAPIYNSRVYVQEMHIEGERELPYTLGRVARGGHTNTNGMTWHGFPRDRRSVAKATVKHQDGHVTTAEINRQPVMRIRPNPTQTVKLCAYR